jgi:hypothetical protein
MTQAVNSNSTWPSKRALVAADAVTPRAEVAVAGRLPPRTLQHEDQRDDNEQR